MAICPNCNVEVSGNFCPLCGQAVPSGQQPQQPQQQIPPQQPYQQPMPGPMPGPIPMGGPGVPLPKKAIAAMILGIIIVILLFIAGATPWYSITSENSSQLKWDWTLSDVTYEYESGEIDTDLEDIQGADFEDVAGLTGLLMLLGTLIMIIVIVLIGIIISLYYMRMHRYNRMFGNLALLFTFIALIFVLIAPIYYMVAWTDEMENYGYFDYIDSFIGSESQGDYETTWGPGIGWILAIVCIILILITMIIVKLGSDEVQKLAPHAPPMPKPQYMPQPPPYQYQPPPQYPPQQPPYLPPQYPPQPPRYP